MNIGKMKTIAFGKNELNDLKEITEINQLILRILIFQSCIICMKIAITIYM